VAPPSLVMRAPFMKAFFSDTMKSESEACASQKVDLT
jgi:hypothetical protein